MTGKQLLDQLRSWVDFFVGWLKWATGVAIALALFSMVMAQFNIAIPYIPAGNPNLWVYIAGIYWLSR